MKNHELSPSEEDYIEMIYRLQLSYEDIKISQLAQALNIKKPSVSKMVKKLHAKDIVTHNNYGTIKLTSKGKGLGDMLLSRHNAVESFLKIIGVENDLHEETEKIEHTINAETLENILKLVSFFNDNPTVSKQYYDYRVSTNIKKNF